MDLSPARSAFLQASRSLPGLTAPDPAYAQLIAPREVAAGDDARVAEMMRDSGCGLVYLGLLRAVLSLPPPNLYRPGKAFEDAYEIAGGTPWFPGGALRLCANSARSSPTSPSVPLPQPGDAILWEPCGAAVAHVDACVTAIAPLSVDPLMLSLTVIAGGQRDGAGHETVKEIERLVRWDGHAWCDSGNGRRMWAIFDADVMAERHGLLDTVSEAG